MKKEASVILAKCAQDKLYGIRIEKRDNDWVRTWAFKLKEETAEKEGFDKINFTGSFYTDEEYPGCPYCCLLYTSFQTRSRYFTCELVL